MPTFFEPPCTYTKITIRKIIWLTAIGLMLEKFHAIKKNLYRHYFDTIKSNLSSLWMYKTDPRYQRYQTIFLLRGFFQKADLNSRNYANFRMKTFETSF